VRAADLVPLGAGALVAALLAPGWLRAFAAAGWTRVNYRGRAVPFPAGVIAVVAAVGALAPLAVAGETSRVPAGVLAFGLGIAFAGLMDDLLDDPARGWRGHAGAVLRGGFSTGLVKAAVTVALALWLLQALRDEPARYALAVAVVALATNLFNLLDLRPGRSVKAFVALGLVLLAATWDTAPLAAIGVLAGPLLVLGIFDLRERAMLGDTGSNLLGGLAGVWLVTTVSTNGQIAVLVVLVALTAYGEVRSFSAAIDRLEPLRRLDRMGRPRG
jgi:UDP-N-acetylmuramyl pentapeptide phosphotransferase/UDP-N-acetylglucosamine-1-phosphate transferase